jgi:hypothetical protein
MFQHVLFSQHTEPFIAYNGRENNGCSDKWGRHEYTWNSTRAPVCWLHSSRTDLGEGVTSIKCYKEVEGTSMEMWAKARATEARPCMNFFQPNQALCGFWNIFLCHTQCKQIRSLTDYFYFMLNANKLWIKLLFIHWSIKCLWGLAPLALSDRPSLPYTR